MCPQVSTPVALKKIVTMFDQDPVFYHVLPCFPHILWILQTPLVQHFEPLQRGIPSYLCCNKSMTIKMWDNMRNGGNITRSSFL